MTLVSFFFIFSLIQYSEGTWTIVGSSETVVVDTGTEAVLPCSYTGNVSLIAWYRGSAPSNDSLLVLFRPHKGWNAYEKVREFLDSRFNITDDFSLVIKNVTLNNQGVYTCQITDGTLGVSFFNHTDVKVKVPLYSNKPPNSAGMIILIVTTLSVSMTVAVALAVAYIKRRRSTNPRFKRRDFNGSALSGIALIGYYIRELRNEINCYVPASKRDSPPTMNLCMHTVDASDVTIATFVNSLHLAIRGKYKDIGKRLHGSKKVSSVNYLRIWKIPDTSETVVTMKPRLELIVGSPGLVPFSYQRAVSAVTWYKNTAPSPDEKLATSHFHHTAKAMIWDAGSQRYNITEDFALQIEKMEEEDEGYYTCQVTDLKLEMLVFNHLDVIVIARSNSRSLAWLLAVPIVIITIVITLIAVRRKKREMHQQHEGAHEEMRQPPLDGNDEAQQHEGSHEEMTEPPLERNDEAQSHTGSQEETTQPFIERNESATMNRGTTEDPSKPIHIELFGSRPIVKWAFMNSVHFSIIGQHLLVVDSTREKTVQEPLDVTDLIQLLDNGILKSPTNEYELSECMEHIDKNMKKFREKGHLYCPVAIWSFRSSHGSCYYCQHIEG